MAPSERGWEEIRVSTALIAVSTVVVVLRFVTRRMKKMVLGLDDWTALVGLILLYGLLIELVLWATIGGNGKHIQTLTPAELDHFFKIFLSNQLTYTLASPVIKLSIVFFYRRIFSVRPFRIVADVLAGLIIAWGLAVFLAAALQCRPLSAFWDRTIDGHCFDGNAYFLGNQIANIIFDFLILFCPIPMIWRLHMRLLDKIALSGVFILGGFACVASIIRVITLNYIDNNDLTYTIYQATLWTLVEPCVGIICGCLPILRGLFRVPARQSSLGSKVKTYLTTGRYATSNTDQTDTNGSRTEYVNLKDADFDRQRRIREVSIETRSEEA